MHLLSPLFRPCRVLLLLPLLLFAATLRAQTTDPSPSPAPFPRTVYTPYEKLEQVFENEGRGVFLPYREFLDLWNKLNLPADLKKNPPPVDGVLASAHYTGRIDGDAAIFDAQLQFEALKDGWSRVPLGGADLNIAEIKPAPATPPDAAPVLHLAADGYEAILPAKGSYPVALTVLGKITRDAGKSTLALRLPRTAASQFELTIPGTGLDFTLWPASAFTTKEENNATKLTAFFGTTQEVYVFWHHARRGNHAARPGLRRDHPGNDRQPRRAAHRRQPSTCACCAPRSARLNSSCPPASRCSASRQRPARLEPRPRRARPPAHRRQPRHARARKLQAARHPGSPGRRPARQAPGAHRRGRRGRGPERHGHDHGRPGAGRRRRPPRGGDPTRDGLTRRRLEVRGRIPGCLPFPAPALRASTSTCVPRARRGGRQRHAVHGRPGHAGNVLRPKLQGHEGGHFFGVGRSCPPPRRTSRRKGMPSKVSLSSNPRPARLPAGRGIPASGSVAQGTTHRRFLFHRDGDLPRAKPDDAVTARRAASGRRRARRGQGRRRHPPEPRSEDDRSRRFPGRGRARPEHSPATG